MGKKLGIPAIVAKRWFQCASGICLLLLVVPLSFGATVKQVLRVQKQPDGVLLTLNPGVMQLQVWSDSSIRVVHSQATTLPSTSSLSVITRPGLVVWTMKDSDNAVQLETETLRVRVDKKTGLVSFLDRIGRVILAEGAEDPGNSSEAAKDSVHARFALQPNEEIYGLGQHQDGLMSYRGTAVKLLQRNTEVGIPVLISSRGYGILWDNPAITSVEIGVKGKESVVDWRSEAGKAVDYYFLYGPATDHIIQEYRKLTGAAPLMGKWFWGFWQSKERYASQQELLDVAARYRDLHLPIDGVVQDWQYWKPGEWGSHEFDPSRYSDPVTMVNLLHNQNFHVFISVWARFDLGLQNTDELEKAGALYPQTYPNVYPKGEGKWYDAFNPKGREIYWRQIKQQLYIKGFDGWWLDASEPELGGKSGEFRTVPTAAGEGKYVFNAYPLMTTTAVYQGQRAATDRRRVAILTRSAYAGQQRNAAVTWSGDIQGHWDVFQKQIPAGLNFSVSGVPYWNTDIGGFFGGDPKDPGYQELFARWFEYGAFCPMFRVHGTGAGKEFWQWDEGTQKIWEKYVDLRYRLLPYIYSVSWQVTHDGGTMMRPLVMDFAEDRQALNIPDQYMFGPAILVSPVTAPVTSRSLYLPGGKDWYNFWTGKREGTAKQITAAAPVDIMPLYVRAGSILPMGPVVEYAQQKSDSPLEIRIYRGANGTFTLYEDEGDNYNYEKGAYTTIPFIWDERSQTLTIGDRRGAFDSMQARQVFDIVFVREGHGAGEDVTENVDQRVEYKGETVTIRASR